MEKHKSIWTSKEEMDLCHEIKLGKPIEKIAKLHQRTEKAIEMRLAGIFNKRLEKGERMSTLTNEFNLTEKQIKYYMNEFEENKKKYDTKTTSQSSKPKNFDNLSTKLDVLETFLKSIDKRLDKIEQITTHIYKNLKHPK